MKFALFLLYVAIEIAAFVGLCYAIGFGWTLLLVVATILGGFWLLRRQGAKTLANLRAAGRSAGSGVPADAAQSAAPVADTALLAAATILMIIPGLVSSAAGILLLLKPVRVLLRPMVIAVGTRKVVSAMEKNYARYGRGMAGVTVVDGQVIDIPDEGPTGYDPSRPQIRKPRTEL
jgi:UPF0716 protein FxsA